MLDTSGATPLVTSWSTDAYPNYCAGVFNTYMRDLDFSPNGDYFIVSTTGAYGGPDSFCDTITRWETARSGGGRAADLDEPHRWRHHLRGDRDRYCGLRRWSHALGQQPLRRRRGRSRRCAA